MNEVVSINKNMVQSSPGEIHIRLYKVMAGVDGIPKNGFNSHSNYHYVRAVDVVKEVKKLLLKNRIGLRVDEEEVIRNEKQGKNSTNFHSQIKCLATFYCVENPMDKETVVYYSASSDKLDKDIFKAKTNGLKYMFIQKFLIESDDMLLDAEQDNQLEKEIVQQPTPQRQQNYNRQDNYNQNYNRPNKQYNKPRGGQISPKQMDYINQLQAEVPGVDFYSQQDLLRMNKRQASDAIDYLRRQLNISGR